LTGTLYIVATPIGNLEDISPRAARTLSEVDFIAAEDTRVTLKLLNHLGIKKHLMSYHAHNSSHSGERILERLSSGENCALVTDAGTPAISDPGETLAAMCALAGAEVIAIPGPCAALSALQVSGLPSGRFTFEGFLSTSRKSRAAHLEELRNERRTMIFYEAPHKLLRTLRDLRGALGDRRASISRELTKLHEQTLRFTLADAISHFEATPPRGEFVIVLEGARETAPETFDIERALELVETYRGGGMKLRDAAQRVSAETGAPKNLLYNLASGSAARGLRRPDASPEDRGD
jgi:16S rRNA (cytidine1402-2'-O)-methyltransferase